MTSEEVLESFGKGGPYQSKMTFRTYYCIYYPAELENDTQKYKPIIWANGSLMIPIFYHFFLKHLASWGYVVIASWSPMPLIDQIGFKGGLKMVQKLNKSDSIFKDQLDLENMGASGHSQGGGVSLLLSKYENIKATVGIQPAPFSCEKTRHPLLIITSDRDIFVWPKLVFKWSYQSSKVLTYWLNHKTATHFMALFSAKDMRAPATAFFQWHLSNNEEAKSCFNADHALATDLKRWRFMHKKELKK